MSNTFKLHTCQMLNRHMNEAQCAPKRLQEGTQVIKVYNSSKKYFNEGGHNLKHRLGVWESSTHERIGIDEQNV
jgi:hypothetical protein